jgi:hypothetical protein
MAPTVVEFYYFIIYFPHVPFLSKRKAQGMILMGAFLTRKYKTAVTAEGRPQYSYPVKTLTIGAELDGLCRVTRIGMYICIYIHHSFF